MPVKMLIINNIDENYPELDELNEFVNILCEDNINEVVYNSLAMIAVELLAADGTYVDSIIETEEGCYFIDTLVKSNDKLANMLSNNSELTILLAQGLLEKLAEKGVLNFEFCTTIINKVNILDFTDNNRKLLLLKFFKSVRSEIVRSEAKKLMGNSGQLMGWMNSLEYQAFDGIDYPSLEVEEKILCLASDFYEVSNGKWTVTDLLNLKTAMTNIDLMPKEKTSYNKIMGRLESNPLLIDKALISDDITNNSNTYGLTVLKFMIKMKTLQDEESFIVDAIEELFLENGIQCNRKRIVSDLAFKYVSGFGSINANVEIDAFDVLVEYIYNIKQSMA